MDNYGDPSRNTDHEKKNMPSTQPCLSKNLNNWLCQGYNTPVSNKLNFMDQPTDLHKNQG